MFATRRGVATIRRLSRPTEIDPATFLTKAGVEHPGPAALLLRIVEGLDSGGDPMSPLRWTSKSIRALNRALLANMRSAPW
jgi:hypothetical protein